MPTVRSYAILVLAAAAGAALCGCASWPAPAEEPVAVLEEPPPVPPQPRVVPPPITASVRPVAPTRGSLGFSVQRRRIETVVFEGSRGSVMILGGIHGDEPASTDLVDLLVAHLEANPSATCGKRVVIIPRANPDGLAAGTRGNARNVDVNRNFCALNFRSSSAHGQDALSEPESRALVTAIATYRPQCIVSVHGPLDCIDPDGGPESEALARAMVAVSPLPYKDLPAMPGSLGSYAGVDLGIAMITYELDRKSTPAGDRTAYLQPHLRALLLAIEKG
jgi:protein MpaA